MVALPESGIRGPIPGPDPFPSPGPHSDPVPDPGPRPQIVRVLWWWAMSRWQGGVAALLWVSFSCGPATHRKGPPRDILAPRAEFFFDMQPKLPIVPAGYTYFDRDRGSGGERVYGSGYVPLHDDERKALEKQRSSFRVDVQVCRDARGFPTEITVLEPVASRAFADAYRLEIGSWRYAPYLLDAHAAATCTVESFDYDLRAYPPANVVPATRLSGDTRIALGEATLQWMAARRVRMLEIKVGLCLDDGGVPRSVTILFPDGVTPEITDYYRSRMMEWRYVPQRIDGKATPSCTTIFFRYRVK